MRRARGTEAAQACFTHDRALPAGGPRVGGQRPDDVRRGHADLVRQTVAGPWRARVGRSGLSANHREGDGTTPLGTYRLGPIVYGLDPDPGLRLRTTG